MEGNDGLPGTGRACYSRRPAEVPRHQLPLLRVQEDSPFVPWRVQRAFQFLDAGDDAEAALCVKVSERVWKNPGGRYFSLCYLRCSAGCEFENSFLSAVSPRRRLRWARCVSSGPCWWITPLGALVEPEV